MMEDFEKLGVFYLGKEYDLKVGKSREGLLLYDSKDLLTHAVCVGMTGSGKTGLCISLIEEAAIDNIPSIIIDPKGDLGNLLLTFPNLKGEDFLPWINLDEARQKNMTPEDFAQSQADLWKKGLASWGEDGQRIQKLRDSADFAIFTPGSSAGIPVSILKSFSAPEPQVLQDSEILSDRISSTVSSLLALIGIEADPIQSREHILLSNIFDQAWRGGKDLDLAALIQQVQTPPLTKIGVLDLETFYPSKARFELVLALNNLLASPGFSAWLEGEPLDINRILYTNQGKPRVAIFSIAHLSDPERMFFVSLLLNQVLGWVRSQSGTTSLRAILYMDEIFGYLPPVSNPPSKQPLLTLLKQARAYGLGLVLATQNPVDIDYKALSNTGTWFIGRLQTERDKARLLDGLEGASATAGIHFNRSEMETIISGLGSRVFLVNNTHEDHPEVFQTRWAMSYLRGPLTRDHIKKLMDPWRASIPQPSDAASASVVQSSVPTAPVLDTRSQSAPTGQPTALPPEITSVYLPLRKRPGSNENLVYMPYLYGAAKIRFASTKLKIDTIIERNYLTPITNEIIPVNMDDAVQANIDPFDLEKEPEEGAFFTDLPPDGSQSKSYTAWNKDFVSWLYGNEKLDCLQSPSTGLISEPEENERAFRIRLQQTSRELRDEEVEKLRKKYSPKIATLQERIRKAEQAVDREKDQAKQQGLQTAISVGATLLGALTGRKAFTKTNIGKATTAVRGAGRSVSAQQDVARAKETVEALNKQLQDLQAEFDAETAELLARVDPVTEELETVTINPRKMDINVQVYTLAWAPFIKNPQGIIQPAFSKD
jgi:hypothetical protein